MKIVARWWSDLSVAKKLFAIVGTMGVLIAIELFTLLFAMQTLSAVRAFVAGEGLWSKAQRDAVHSLTRYTMDRDPRDLQEFRRHLEVNLGDRRARLALQKDPPDRKAAREGFLAGNNDPVDIDGMIDLLLRFHKNVYLAKAIEAWTQADVILDEIIDLADEIHIEAQKPDYGRHKVRPLLSRIEVLNREVTELENEFSYTLGVGSRWMESVLMMLLVILVVTVEGTGLILTGFFSSGLVRDLRALNDVAVRVGQGDFGQVLPVRSRDELGLLSESINRMTETLRDSLATTKEAETASEAKSLFLANMSHEIRTPLGAIIGFAELLRDPNLPAEERERYLEVVYRTGLNLSQIVNDILDLSKIEAGHIEIDEKNFSLKLVLSDLYTLLSLRASQKNLQLNFEYASSLPDQIFSDPVRLRQILMNVVGNAIKYTDHGHIDVLCSADAEQLLFKVRDTGVGISPPQRNALFQPFSQCHSATSQKREGTGLGLILSRKLAAAMNGSVELIDSHPGQGSEFQIRVAYRPGKVEVRAPSTVSPQDLNGKKILVVDDSADNQMLVQLGLTRAGADVEVAANGEEGVRKVLERDYDVVIMDMQMPIMDGYSATRKLRELGFQKPIIAVTAFAMKEDREKCLRSGCSNYLSKPLNLQLLVQEVRGTFQRDLD